MHVCKNSAEKQAMTDAWKRVHAHEISRRLLLHREDPAKASRVFAVNAKPFRPCNDESHVWVPAVNLMIHDKGAGSYVIHNVRRRGFREAKPYRFFDWLVQPQICWYCDATREVFSRVVSAEQRRSLAEQISQDAERERLGKPRGRMGSGDVFDMNDMSFFIENEVVKL